MDQSVSQCQHEFWIKLLKNPKAPTICFSIGWMETDSPSMRPLGLCMPSWICTIPGFMRDLCEPGEGGNSVLSLSFAYRKSHELSEMVTGILNNFRRLSGREDSACLDHQPTGQSCSSIYWVTRGKLNQISCWRRWKHHTII